MTHKDIIKPKRIKNEFKEIYFQKYEIIIINWIFDNLLYNSIATKNFNIFLSENYSEETVNEGCINVYDNSVHQIYSDEVWHNF